MKRPQPTVTRDAERPDARSHAERGNEETRTRWIAFDAVGTLIHPEPAVGQVYFDVARRHGSRLSLAEITARFPRAFRATERNDLAGVPGNAAAQLVTSEERERARWRQIVAAVIDDVPDTKACFEELFAHFARPASWRCFDDAGPVLARLKGAGYRLAIASNFDGRLHAVCDGLPELRPIECRVISAAVGHRKPSLLFYEALLAAAGCRRSELLIVGDDYENDIAGAQAAGIPALFLNRKGPAGAGEISTLDQILFSLV